MEPFTMEIAGTAVEVISLFETTKVYCREYLTDRVPEFQVKVERDDLIREQELLNAEADAEGLKRRKFAEPFLERSFIQRRVAENLAERNIALLHGSTVAVDGAAYLFTAPCGTGKSTHTRLWREVFGDRAVMVNDDKPFLKIEEERILACGSPWTGKHGLGSNVCVPLKGICILARGSENIILPAEEEAALDFLRGQCCPPERAEEILRRVPVWKMKCSKDHEAAQVAHMAMSRKQHSVMLWCDTQK